MNKIFEKRLDRKRTLAGRVKCHGTKTSCQREHMRARQPVFTPPPVPQKPPEQRKGFLKKLFTKNKENWYGK